MGLLDTLFGRKDTNTVKMGRRPAGGAKEQDLTEGYTADSKTLEAIYHGEAVGFQLAMGLAYVPVAVPVNLVSIPAPTPVEEHKDTQQVLDSLVEDFSDEFGVIEGTKQVQGTGWRWVRYDARGKRIVWELIPDDSIVMIEKDLISGEITGIWTHDRFQFAVNDTNTAYAERKRHITRNQITVTWIQKGTAELGLRDTTQRNPFGFLPVPFGHDCKPNEWRGHSVYGRTLRLMKAHHDIFRTMAEILSDFMPKMIHTVDNVGEWLKNNGYGEGQQAIVDLNNNVFGSRFFLNQGEKEKSDFLYLKSDATKQHVDALNLIRENAIAASPIPEIFYGNLATGNEASVDAHKDLAISYIHQLRQENIRPYTILFNQSLAILSFVQNRSFVPAKVDYESVSLMSESAKALVFKNVAQGISALVANASGTPEDMLYFWKKFYPNLPENDIKAFSKGLIGMAKHKAMSNSDFLTQLDSDEGDDDDAEGSEPEDQQGAEN